MLSDCQDMDFFEAEKTATGTEKQNLDCLTNGFCHGDEIGASGTNVTKQ